MPGWASAMDRHSALHAGFQAFRCLEWPDTASWRRPVEDRSSSGGPRGDRCLHSHTALGTILPQGMRQVDAAWEQRSGVPVVTHAEHEHIDRLMQLVERRIGEARSLLERVGWLVEPDQPGGIRGILQKVRRSKPSLLAGSVGETQRSSARLIWIFAQSSLAGTGTRRTQPGSAHRIPPDLRRRVSVPRSAAPWRRCRPSVRPAAARPPSYGRSRPWVNPVQRSPYHALPSRVISAIEATGPRNPPGTV